MSGKRAETAPETMLVPTTVPALQRRVMELEAALAASEQKLAGVLAAAAALDCCPDGKVSALSRVDVYGGKGGGCQCQCH